MYVILPTNDVYIDEDALALVAEIGRTTPTLAMVLFFVFPPFLPPCCSFLLPSSFFILPYYRCTVRYIPQKAKRPKKTWRRKRTKKERFLWLLTLIEWTRHKMQPIKTKNTKTKTSSGEDSSSSSSSSRHPKFHLTPHTTTHNINTDLLTPSTNSRALFSS